MSDPNVNDRNMTESDFQANQSANESSWTPPPFPEGPVEDEEPIPEISEVQSLTSIFYEPSRVFQSFRRKPRFVSALIIIILITTAYLALYMQRVGFENLVRATIENSRGAEQMSPEAKEQQVKIQTMPVVKAFWYVGLTLFFIIGSFIGGLIYMAGVKIMGGEIRYFQALSVWVYAWYPPILIATLLNFLLLYIKSPDSYDLVMGLNGLVQANLGFLVSMKSSPVLFTLLSSFDVFRFFGMFLAATGLRVIGKISSGLAWGIVIGFWALITAISLLFASMR